MFFSEGGRNSIFVAYLKRTMRSIKIQLKIGWLSKYVACRDDTNRYNDSDKIPNWFTLQHKPVVKP